MDKYLHDKTHMINKMILFDISAIIVTIQPGEILTHPKSIYAYTCLLFILRGIHTQNKSLTANFIEYNKVYLVSFAFSNFDKISHEIQQLSNRNISVSIFVE